MKLYYRNKINAPAGRWHKPRKAFFPRKSDFEYLQIKINGKEYTEWTVEFEQKLVWLKLSNKNDTV